MKVLILTFRAGEGHNSAAKAVLDCLHSRGHTGEIVDFLSLFSPRLSDSINRNYIRMVKHAPVLYGIFYRMAYGVSNLIRRAIHSPLYLDSAIISKRLWEYMSEHGPYDGIVATHIMPSQALVYLKKHGRALPTTVSIVTDYTWYPFWQETCGCDHYILPHEGLIEKYVKKGMPRERLHPYGIPISARFEELPTRSEARVALGFSDSDRLYLVMGGSMGAGSIARLAKRLFDKLGDAKMVVVCGSNEKLRASLDRALGESEQVRLLGFTPDIASYMVACDVLFTKPGGLSTSEALACRIPMVLISPIPGQESDNLKFFVKLGCAYGANRIRDQLRLGMSLMASEELREQMRAVQKRCAKPSAARDIVCLLETCATAEKKEG